MGSAYDKAAPPVIAGIRYAEEVKAATNGAITINVFPNSAIGTEREQFTQVAANELEFTVGGMLTAYYCPEYGFLSAPFLYKDMDHIKNIMTSPLGDAMLKKFLEYNTNLIGIMWRGIRNTSSNKAIRTPDDVKGLKIRMTEMPSWVAIWRDGLGATTIPIVLGELYGALQNGVADASEGPYEQLATYKFYEVQKYLINTNHVMEWCGLYASQKMLDSLPPELSKILDDKAKSVMTDYGSQLCAEKAEDFRQELLKGGMEEINVNVQEFTNKLLPVYKQFFDEKKWVSSIEEIMSFAK
jgi:tripartite ATP-independent transporter DctP family solute receptor